MPTLCALLESRLAHTTELTRNQYTRTLPNLQCARSRIYAGNFEQDKLGEGGLVASSTCIVLPWKLFPYLFP